MEQYEAMMDSSQLPPIPTSNPNPMSSYQGGPISFPQFSDTDSMNSSGYGNLPGMTGSYPTTPTTPGGAGGNISMGGYNTPGSQPSPYSTSSSSFSMPYDPPPMQGTPSIPMPTPPPPTQQSMKPVYSCTYCGLVLSSNNALIEHKRIHTGERPYACHICTKRFTQKAHLNIHKRIHTGEKPYACHICHKRFAQSSHLSSHKRIHTGEKPFVCGICHIGFTQKQRLDVHLKKHMERPGQDITPVTRRPPLVMANQVRMADRMEAYRPGLHRDDSINMMHMVGQGMPYIKQETGIGEMPPGSNHNLHPGMEYKGEEIRDDADQRTAAGGEGQMDVGEKRREQMEGDSVERNNQNKPDPNTAKNPNINAASFSSEGMFLHPSGYVAYGGIEDNEETQNSPRTGDASNPAGGGSVAQQMSPPHAGHRRKSSFVRKRQSESPDKVGVNPGEPGDNSAEVVNGLHRFNALNPNPDGLNRGAEGGSGGVDDEEEEEEDDEDAENGEGEDYKDTGEVLDDKNDPPYHGSMHRNINYDHHHQSTRKGNVPVSAAGIVETRSHTRRTSSGHEELVNGDRMGANPGQSLSYAGPTNSFPNPGLVKVNNRISLVNFTADELLTHLMKRDDVHCCQFCCLIFQDAAMYHIHRNMHDKQDIRKCNMCGKMLLDKYDFTAHFLSMHQN